MRSARFARVAAVCVGACIMLMWAAFLALGQVPELATRPAEIALHLAAEFTPGILLVASGAPALRGRAAGGVLLMAAHLAPAAAAPALQARCLLRKAH